MFEVGDRVICIDSSNSANSLELYKSYYITKVHYINKYLYVTINDKTFYPIRFISVLDYRKQKLKKICLKLEIK